LRGSLRSRERGRERIKRGEGRGGIKERGRREGRKGKGRVWR